jgi:hypothetical protein
MASAPTITPKKRHGMERPLIPGEIDSTPVTIIPTLVITLSRVPCQWILLDLFEEKCYAWNDLSISFSRSFSQSDGTEASSLERTVPSRFRQASGSQWFVIRSQLLTGFTSRVHHGSDREWYSDRFNDFEAVMRMQRDSVSETARESSRIIWSVR